MPITLQYTGKGVYLKRLNRFVVLINAGGSRVKCHLNDTGRLDHVLEPGNSTIYYRNVLSIGRKTGCSVVAGTTPFGELVVLDSRVPNMVFEHHYKEILGDPESELVKEPSVQGARLDFLVSGRSGVWAVEVKGVNLSVGSTGLFPNAPSTRALRHLEVLARLALEGYKAAMVYVALRNGIDRIAPNRRVDPRFASLSCSLRDRVLQLGVRVKVEEGSGSISVEYAGRAHYTCS